MKQWHKDKRWSDKFLPEIKRNIGEHLITEPPVEEDAERNTDLMVLRLDAIRIGCRVRKNQYETRYGDEFTIRAGRPSGVKTELAKIIEGWGDYLFYGFCDQRETSLSRWIIGDLKKFRIWYMGELYRGKHPGFSKGNFDGSSTFISFNVHDIPDFVTASNWFRREELF